MNINNYDVNQYDVIIIGAGMSAMAAGIRLSMFDKKVLIVEQHSISGGLNSYYKRGKRSFDVGLHALTNFAKKNEKGLPLTKLLKQLRIPWEELQLKEQHQSQIHFPEKQLIFSNDFNVLIEEISQKFPSQIDGFIKLNEYISNFNETALTGDYQSAKSVIKNYIEDPLLREMLMAPLLIYGSAWENDMDFSQFAIMYKSIYQEGFSRPEGGVRTIINLLLKKLEDNNCSIKFKTKVSKILKDNNQVIGIETEKGEQFLAPLILSSAGLPETMQLTQSNSFMDNIGKLSFTETIINIKEQPKNLGQNNTIIFYNNSESYNYERPKDLVDYRSAVICMPNNFKEDELTEGMIRITNMANYDLWKSLERKEYLNQKNIVFEKSVATVKEFLPLWNGQVAFKDVFSPTTIERYTGHLGGTVYGSTKKIKDGNTQIKGLKIIGTDQGFLGIVGSMLSGISMANLHGLME